MEQAQNPDDYFILLDQRRARLAENEEVISDKRFEDIMLRGITSDFDYIRNTSYRDPNFGLKDTQSTMRRMYIDDLSCKDKPKIAGRGAAMSARHAFFASKRHFRCFNCDKPGHRKSERPQLKNESSVPLQRVAPKQNGAPTTGQLPTVMSNAAPKISEAPINNT